MKNRVTVKGECNMQVYVEKCEKYDSQCVENVIKSWENIFADRIVPGDTVVIKPNWIAPSHKYKKDEWEQVITHPSVITAVLKIVLEKLNGKGKVLITDGPLTSASWKKIMDVMIPSRWVEMGKKAQVEVVVLDLRDDEWLVKGDMIVKRETLPGDPLGSTVCNLKDKSEFVGKKVNELGFFGSDYNTKETNDAHLNGNHFYKVSRSVLEADVFINLPKLKSHKKAGITCSLKNLVGINTYKNWLPHHMEGAPSEGGDQFPPSKGFRATAEGSLTRVFYSYIASRPSIAKFFIPVKKVGKIIFGDTRKTIRSGSWFGNDTLWRTVLDLNKILLYSNSDGNLRDQLAENRKKYISLVDAVVAGDGNGPDAPDKKHMGILVLGTDPVAVDVVCAKFMGFDWRKIPIITKSFNIKKYSITECSPDNLNIISSINQYNKKINLLNRHDLFKFNPAMGWKGKIEDGI